MANIPEDAISLKDDTDDASPDERNPQQMRDKHIEHDNEFIDGRASGNKNAQSYVDGAEPMDLDKHDKDGKNN